jgi:hypothetical protein
MRTTLAKSLKTAAVGAALTAMASIGHAATQGTPGATSTGTVNINLIVNNQVRISALTDITLPFLGPDAVGASDACIYRNTTGTYQITATGNGAGNAFLLDDGSGVTIPYITEYDDGSGFQAMTTGSPLTTQTGADNDIDCANVAGSNGVVQVTVDGPTAAALPSATYAGVLTLVVAPE